MQDPPKIKGGAAAFGRRPSFTFISLRFPWYFRCLTIWEGLAPGLKIWFFFGFSRISYKKCVAQHHARPFGQSRFCSFLQGKTRKNIETQQTQGLSVRESRVAMFASWSMPGFPTIPLKCPKMSFGRFWRVASKMSQKCQKMFENAPKMSSKTF